MKNKYILFLLVILFSIFSFEIASAIAITTITDTKVTYVDGIIKVEDNKVEFLHNDYLGTTRRVSDATTGEQTLSSDYYYFGGELDKTGYSAEYGSSLKKAFTSKEQDDKSGLYYFGARYYNPAIGRFTSVDPLYDPLITTYHYAANNPLKLIDPDGKKPIRISTTIIDKYPQVANSVMVLGSAIPEIIALASDPFDHFVFDRNDMPIKSWYDGAMASRIKAGQRIDNIYGATVPLGTHTGVDVEKMEKDFPVTLSYFLLHTILHELVHQYDHAQLRLKHPDWGELEIIEEIKKPENEQKNELRVEERLVSGLALHKTYYEQLQDSNSWVHQGVSKQGYDIIADKFKQEVENERRVLRQQQTKEPEPPKYKFTDEQLNLLRDSAPADHTAVYSYPRRDEN